MSEDFVTITVDGRELKAPKGAMLISVTDEHGIRIPRFCYHKKLSVSANCRMCLVEVEKAPKPMPACATPVMDGMVVHTKSPKAIAAQKSVMEFLLINHPLDCPVCDQGGECELQDLSVGFGGDTSQYTDVKRVVFDKDIGPLIATEMTRCIQCTRCVRFGEEIAGMRELGATGRGDRMQVGTYIEKTVDSEMSGNVIDICPVGALTAKPSRFSVRAWELAQHPAIAPHDCVGSNIYVHTFRGKVTRVVPRDNEELNEVWISDRDRFSYQGLYAEDRVGKPMIKEGSEWREAEWDEALEAAVAGLQSVIKEQGAEQFGCWASPHATLEELYLLQKIVRGLGSANLDHRLRQTDFSDQQAAPVMPWLGQDIVALEKLDAALLIGSNVRKEQPIIAHRLRKAAIKQDPARISFVNPRAFDWHMPVSQQCVSSASGMLEDLAAIAKAAFAAASQTVPAELADALNAASVTAQHQQIVDELKQAQNATVLLGSIAHYHPQFAALRALAEAIAMQTGSVFGYLPEAANSAGAWLAGVLPHRGVAGQEAGAGKNFAEMMEQPRAALLSFNVEPEFDSSHSLKALQAARAARFVVAVSSFASDNMKDYADVILPLSAFTETSGTYVNAEGFWQSFRGVTAPLGESRPGWKILRVMGNLFNLDGFEFNASDEVREEIRSHCRNVQLNNALPAAAPVRIDKPDGGLQRIGEVPIYAVDSLVRRASALQRTKDAVQDGVRINSDLAQRLGVTGAAKVKVTQDGGHAYLPLVIDDGIPDDCAWIASGLRASASLGNTFGPVELEKV